jgi:hypothetical protein
VRPYAVQDKVWVDDGEGDGERHGGDGDRPAAAA